MGQFNIEEFARAAEALLVAEPQNLEALRVEAEAAIERCGTDAVIAALEGAVPAGADLGELIVHQSPALTMLYGRVPAHFRSAVHDHTIGACIVQLTGKEKNVIYRESDGALEVESETTLGAGEVIVLPADAVHHIENPVGETSRALHLYAGDFSAVRERRSLWSHQEHRRSEFSFAGVLKESVAAMKAEENQEGLSALVEAMPKARALVDAP